MTHQIRDTWDKAFLAFLRVAILFVFMGLHWLLAAMLHEMLHKRWPLAEDVLFGLSLLAFSLIYVDQLWETVGIFVPRLEQWRRKVVGRNIPWG